MGGRRPDGALEADVLAVLWKSEGIDRLTKANGSSTAMCTNGGLRTDE